MGMGIANIRAAMKSSTDGLVVGSYTLAAARNILGYNRLPDDSEMLDELVTDGPYVVILPGSKLEDILGDPLQYPQKKYQVKSVVWIGIDKETNDDFEDIENFIEGIAATYRIGGGIVTNTSWQYRESNVTATGSAIAVYELHTTIVGC
jgi:hypothetical protein